VLSWAVLIGSTLLESRGRNHMPNLTNHSLEHDLFPFGTDTELVEGIVPFLREGLAAGQPAIIVATSADAALLREGLGGDADRVWVIDSDSWYVRPAAAIADYDSVLHELADGGAAQIRLAGQLPQRMTPEERRSWTRYESVLNRALRDHPVWVVCMYDTRVEPLRAMLADALRTHPTVWEGGARRPSPRFVDPEALLSELPEPAGRLGDTPALCVRVDRHRNCWREPVAAAGVRGGLSRERIDELIVAIGEVVANAVQHGAPPVELAAWVAPGELVCEVGDHGGGPMDPLAGYVPPGRAVPLLDDGPARGTGLWIARQLSDTLTVRSGHDGTTVRLGVRAQPGAD
jgi:anti-sigma regulatory factor (Ser/Thr protein kinase)